MLRCRKNQSTLTAQEKARFVAAVLALKANGKYDQYVVTHRDNMPAAHRGPAFFPWHREFLRRFELDLQSVDSSVTLPYWDWTVDSSPIVSLWNDDFLGPNGRPSDGQVMTGAFAYAGGNWTLTVDGPALRRRFGVSPSAPSLPTPGDLSNALAVVPYDVAPYNDGSSLAGFRNTLEGWRSGPQLHNRVHVWVGGSMGPASSPNDPVFFLHHCFIDKLWAAWQALHPGEGYVPVSGGPAGHNLNDSMEPWASQGVVVTPASVLDHHALGYAYDTEGVCQGTFKLRDDLPTFKFRDDRPTLKAFDDLPTLKIRDDLPTFKFVDDPSTLKLRDDLPTVKFADDPGTLKFFDDGGGGTLKAIDDVKLPALDKQPALDATGVVKAAEDPIGPAWGPPGRPAPFVLATPHHSMAWVHTFPGSLENSVAELEAQLREYQTAIALLESRQGGGAATSSEAAQLQGLRQEFEALVAEHDQLARQVGRG